MKDVETLNKSSDLIIKDLVQHGKVSGHISENEILEAMGKVDFEPDEIEKLYDAETGEEIDTVNPGVKEQKVKLKIPCSVKPGYIVRRIK